MKLTVIAALDGSPADDSVRAMAAALAAVMGAEVEDVREADAEAVDVLSRRAQGDHVVALVLAAASHHGRGELGHVTRALLSATLTPVAVVPPGAEVPARVERALVAMSGTPGNARTLAAAVGLAADAHVDVVVVHVDDEASMPRFSDQPHHEHEAFATEFLARYCPVGLGAVRLLLRVGAPAGEVLAAVGDVEPDLVVAGLPTEMSEARGRVAAEILERCDRPVLLLPLVD